MADKDKPEEGTEKKKGLLGGSKIPLDGVVLVVVPFVTFVLLFMYVMGLLPPRPMTIKVVGATPMEQVQAPGAGAPEVTAPMPPLETAGNLLSDAEAGRGPEDMMPVLPESADSITADAGGAIGVESATEGSASEAVVTEEGAEDEPSTEVAEIDGDRMERIKQLAKVYEQMNASSVAAIVTTMDDDDAVDILSHMKPRNAAKVLASLEPEIAAKLSLRLTE
jgi:hypothetical protein